MSWINFLLIKKLMKDFILVSSITVVLFIIANLVFVYFSPAIVPNLPVNFVREISPCYRTLYHTDLSDTHSVSRYEIVFGDSNSEGAGDEFLNGEKTYGLFRKLQTDADRSFLIFGRGGYGNIGTIEEERRCFPLIQNFTMFSYDPSQIERVSFVFYEGNDLNNNLRELDRVSSDQIYFLKFFLPFGQYGYRKIRELYSRVTSLFRSVENHAKALSKKMPYPISDSGVQLGLYPQSAALELSENELNAALSALRKSLISIRDKYPKRQFQFLYLPAVASSYSIKGPLPVEGYRGSNLYMATGEENDSRNLVLRGMLKSITSELGWKFCDMTTTIKSFTSEGYAVHGPKDWKHFNKTGYDLISKQYLRCFSIH